MQNGYLVRLSKIKCWYGYVEIHESRHKLVIWTQRRIIQIDEQCHMATSQRGYLQILI